LQPSKQRQEELHLPWEEGALHKQLSLRKAPEGVPEFLTAIHGSSSGLFTKDPAFWQTVHCGGDSWEELQQELKTAAKEAWKDKVVVKYVHFHTLGYSTDTPAQGDKYKGLLKDSPQKKGFKVAEAPPAPISMDLATPWQGSMVRATGSLGHCDKTKWMSEQPFTALGTKQRSQISMPGRSDATTAAMHDSYYKDGGD